MNKRPREDESNERNIRPKYDHSNSLLQDLVIESGGDFYDIQKITQSLKHLEENTKPMESEEGILEIQGSEEAVGTSKQIPGFKVENLEEIIECVICNDRLVTPYILHCNYTYCKKCITEWLRITNTCSTRGKMILKPPAHNKRIQQILDVCTNHQKEEDKKDL